MGELHLAAKVTVRSSTYLSQFLFAEHFPGTRVIKTQPVPGAGRRIVH